jgi:tRNA threonylcarbamoyladenosine biosynthesis protein TsaE
LKAKTNSVEETIFMGKEFGEQLQAGDVVVLSGDLGAGKTQFVRGIASAFGIKEAITSPTFNILKQYDSEARVGKRDDGEACVGKRDDGGVCAGKQGGATLNHWDLYRLNDEKELEDIDFYGELESGAINLIEWGDKFPNALPDDCLQVEITLGNNSDERMIEISRR